MSSSNKRLRSSDNSDVSDRSSNKKRPSTKPRETAQSERFVAAKTDEPTRNTASNGEEEIDWLTKEEDDNTPSGYQLFFQQQQNEIRSQEIHSIYQIEIIAKKADKKKHLSDSADGSEWNRIQEAVPSRLVQIVNRRWKGLSPLERVKFEYMADDAIRSANSGNDGDKKPSATQEHSTARQDAANLETTKTESKPGNLSLLSSAASMARALSASNVPRTGREGTTESTIQTQPSNRPHVHGDNAEKKGTAEQHRDGLLSFLSAFASGKVPSEEDGKSDQRPIDQLTSELAAALGQPVGDSDQGALTISAMSLAASNNESGGESDKDAADWIVQSLQKLLVEKAQHHGIDDVVAELERFASDHGGESAKQAAKQPAPPAHCQTLSQPQDDSAAIAMLMQILTAPRTSQESKERKATLSELLQNPEVASLLEQLSPEMVDQLLEGQTTDKTSAQGAAENASSDPMAKLEEWLTSVEASAPSDQKIENMTPADAIQILDQFIQETQQQSPSTPRHDTQTKITTSTELPPFAMAASAPAASSTVNRSMSTNSDGQSHPDAESLANLLGENGDALRKVLENLTKADTTEDLNNLLRKAVQQQQPLQEQDESAPSNTTKLSSKTQPSQQSSDQTPSISRTPPGVPGKSRETSETSKMQPTNRNAESANLLKQGAGHSITETQAGHLLAEQSRNGGLDSQLQELVAQHSRVQQSQRQAGPTQATANQSNQPKNTSNLDHNRPTKTVAAGHNITDIQIAQLLALQSTNSGLNPQLQELLAQRLSVQQPSQGQIRPAAQRSVSTTQPNNVNGQNHNSVQAPEQAATSDWRVANEKQKQPQTNTSPESLMPQQTQQQQVQPAQQLPTALPVPALNQQQPLNNLTSSTLNQLQQQLQAANMVPVGNINLLNNPTVTLAQNLSANVGLASVLGLTNNNLPNPGLALGQNNNVVLNQNANNLSTSLGGAAPQQPSVQQLLNSLQQPPQPPI